MDRLLVLRLESHGVEAEAVFNGVPLLRVGPGRPVALVPVHEYTFSGGNRLELLVQPGPPQALGAAPALGGEAELSDGQRWASVRLLLPRSAGVASPASARTLAQLDWAPPADEVCEWPVSQQTAVDLPIAFPRWRWVDAPVVVDSPTLKREVVAYLRDIALGLARGNPEPLVQASRLRLEDLAQAYQRNLADDVGRLRLQVQQSFAAQPLKPELPTVAKLLLRPVAGGRLLECLRPDGSPVLQSPVPGGHVAWPVRLAAIDGRFYVLR